MSFTERCIPMGSRGRFLDYVRSGSLIETYMAKKRMAHSALRKYVSLERAVLMGASSYLTSLSRRASRLLRVRVLFSARLLLVPHLRVSNKLPNIHPKASPFLFVRRIISQDSMSQTGLARAFRFTYLCLK